MVVDDGLSGPAPCEHRLVDAVAVVDYDGVRHVEDSRRRAVVLVEDYIPVGAERHEYVRLGPSPLVDGLVGVSHHEEVAAHCGESLDDVPVDGVAVLRLVHHNVVHPLLPLFAHVREGVQDMAGEVHEVVEVKGELVLLLEEQLGSLRELISSLQR